MTVELIAEKLWNRGWKATWEYCGSSEYIARLTWRHSGGVCPNSIIGNGNSALVALERCRDKLDAEERKKP